MVNSGYCSVYCNNNGWHALKVDTVLAVVASYYLTKSYTTFKRFVQSFYYIIGVQMLVFMAVTLFFALETLALPVLGPNILSRKFMLFYFLLLFYAVFASILSLPFFVHQKDENLPTLTITSTSKKDKR